MKVIDKSFDNCGINMVVLTSGVLAFLDGISDNGEDIRVRSLDGTEHAEMKFANIVAFVPVFPAANVSKMMN